METTNLTYGGHELEPYKSERFGEWYWCLKLSLHIRLWSHNGRDYRNEIWPTGDGAHRAELWERNDPSGKGTLIWSEDYPPHVYGAKPFEDLDAQELSTKNGIAA
jgi:hypothetical protein